MNLELIEHYKQTRPVDVVCYFGNLWEMDVLLTEEQVQAEIDNYQASHPDVDFSELSQKNKRFVATTILCTNRNIEGIKRHFPEEEYYLTNSLYGKYLAYIKSGYSESMTNAPETAARFGLEFREAECLWSMLSWRRLDDEYVIALMGDDRGWEGGSYAIAVGYAPVEFMEAWSTEEVPIWLPCF